VLITVARNCWEPLTDTDALVGEMLTETGDGALIVTEAAADFVVSACEVAVTVTVFGFGVVAGAV
jgi:hypothetical protein